MAGINIVLRDREEKIKQDLKISRNNVDGKVVEIDSLKKKEIEEKIKLEALRKWTNLKYQTTKKK